MNGTISRVTTADAAVRRQAKAQSGNGSVDGDFQSMLSGSIEAGPGAREMQKTETEGASEQTKPQKAEHQISDETKPQEQPPCEDEEELQEYGRQAAVIQSQMIIPIAAEAPQAEIPADTVDTVEAIAETPVQAAETAAQTEVGTAVEAPIQTGEAPKQEAQAKATTQMGGEQARTENQPEASRTFEPETVRQEPTAGQTAKNTRNPQEQESIDAAKETENGTADTEATETARQAHPAVEMHNLRHPQKTDAEQTRFGDILAKASQQLNPSAKAEETKETEAPGKAIEPEEPIIFEAKPDGQKPEIQKEEISKAEIKPQEKAETQPNTKPHEEIKEQDEAKPLTIIQKSPKASVAEQRPQKEISKTDEAALAMAQPKQPEAAAETVRREPVQQPGQAQTPGQAEQIKAQVIKNLETRKTEFEMQLNPEELGKINVKMILESGKLTVEIMTANPKSAELLSRQAESLAASLKAGNIENASISVVAAAENASASMNGEYDLNNFQGQFQNQAHTRRQGGRPNGSGGSGEQTANGEREEARRAPQRILNYSV